MLPEWSEVLFPSVLEWSVRTVLLAAAVGGILVLLRVRSGGLRHAAWTAVLGAMLLMPLLKYFLPAIPVAGLPVRPAVVAGARLPEPPAYSQAASPMPSPPMTGQGGVSVPSQDAALASEPMVDPVPPTPVVPLVLLAVYVAGTTVLAARLLLGWRQVNRLACMASPVEVPQQDPGTAAQFRESDLIVTPLSVGVLSQKVILPTGWRRWSDEKLQAVLAHECAHVRRHDPLVALLAHLNRCVFWFHPLSWWLERKLATTAEQACDEAAVRAIGERQRYAAILLDMADAVRRRGSRFSWQGVGVQGTGFLSQRIDRILRGDFTGESSRFRKSIVAAGCAAAIFLAAACREQAPTVAPLMPDPKQVQLRAEQKAESDFDQAARDMNVAQVDELEAALKKDPEDLVALKKLLTFYEPLDFQVPGKEDQWAPKCAQVLGAKRCVEARRAHILWLIGHHPEDRLAGGWLVRIFTTNLDPLPDPAGFEQAKKLWLEKTAGADVNVQMLKNAASFFEVPDKALAERMLLRAQALDPKGKYSGSLGRLYALTVMGANSSMPLNVLRSVSMEDARGAYAREIRKKLDESNDPVLLQEAAGYLGMARQFFQRNRIDFDAEGLAKTYYERALQLNPQNVRLRERLRMMSGADGDRSRKLSEIRKQNPTESARYDAISALPDAERLYYLPQQAEGSYMMAEYYDYSRKDEARAKTGFEYAGKYAQDALRLGSRLTDHLYSSPAVYIGNMVLGTLAFRGGDRTAAVKYMLAASHAPASADLDPFIIFHTRLTGQLLKYGERDSVIEFLERIAQVSTTQKDYLLESADKIRKGIQPLWYPRESQAAPQGK